MEFKSGQGKVRENVFCMWSITASIVLYIKKGKKRSSLLGKVLHREHSCHSYAYCGEK